MIRLLLIVGLFVVVAHRQALAHGFAGGGWLHPLTGPDHMVAMVAVGIWSAQRGGRTLWLAPTLFVVAMGVGAVVGYEGWGLPGGATIIPLSVLLLGVALFSGVRLVWPVAVGGILLFGLAHGHAHGAEMPGEAAPIGYAVGFLVTTAGLHIAGAATGLLLLERPDGRRWLRLAGPVLDP